jgi:uncharacterized protein (DUF1499 family)
MPTSLIRSLLGVALVLLTTFATAADAFAGPGAPIALGALPVVGNLAGDRPTTLGLKDGQLAPCPRSPNCVVSQGNADAEHSIAPLAYEGDPAIAWDRLQAVVQALPRTAIIEATDTYLYAEFTSRWMGYVDDVEFYLQPEASQIQVRSASRLGESDLGVNRQRIETLRTAFAA